MKKRKTPDKRTMREFFRGPGLKDELILLFLKDIFTFVHPLDLWYNTYGSSMIYESLPLDQV